MNDTYCPRCGGRNPVNVPFCNNCGMPLQTPPLSTQPPYPPTNYYPPPPPPNYPAVQPARSNRAMIAMICAVLGFVACGPLTSVPGIILAKMELDAIREGKASRESETTAKWAFNLSIAATVLSALVCFMYWGRFA